MSPTFIQLKHFVLLSLVVAEAIHLSSSFVEAAPATRFPNQPMPTTGESLIPPYIKSDFDLTIPTISSHSDIPCGLDWFKSSHCRPPTLLIRRNNDDDSEKMHIINAEWNEFCRLGGNDSAAQEKRINILKTQTAKISEILDSADASRELRASADAARRHYVKFIRSLSFQDLRHKMDTLDLVLVLLQIGAVHAAAHDPETRLTRVVFQFLNSRDFKTIIPVALRTYLIANEITGLRKDCDPSSMLPHPTWDRELGVLIANEYLRKYRDLLLMSKEYTLTPQNGDFEDAITHCETEAATTTDIEILRNIHISEILLRYTQWTQSKDTVKLVLLEEHFKSQLVQSPPLIPAVKLVLEVYVWLLSQLGSEKAS